MEGKNEDLYGWCCSEDQPASHLTVSISINYYWFKNNLEKYIKYHLFCTAHLQNCLFLLYEK